MADAPIPSDFSENVNSSINSDNSDSLPLENSAAHNNINPKIISAQDNDAIKHQDLSLEAIADYNSSSHRNFIIVTVFFLAGFAWVCRKALFGLLVRGNRKRYRRVGRTDTSSGYESNPDSSASGHNEPGCVQGFFKHGNYTMAGADNLKMTGGDESDIGSGWSDNEGDSQDWEKW